MRQALWAVAVFAWILRRADGVLKRGAIVSETNDASLERLRDNANANETRETKDGADSSAARAGTGTVCVSLAAYEEPAYLEALFANMDKFLEPGTKVAVHLNRKSDYGDADIAKWDLRKNVAITPARIAVAAFTGKVMQAHLLNVQTMESRWPGQCKFFLMQASNMMWVRKGMESIVRQSGFSAIQAIPEPHVATGKHPFTRELDAGKGLYGWEVPEGSFFPMQVVRDFLAKLDAFVQSRGETLQAVGVFEMYFEASWLASYSLNFANYDLKKHYPPSLCYRWVNDRVLSAEDSVPLDDVKRVISREGKMSQFYAVKRVKRDLRDPVTSFIVNLEAK